MTQATITDEIIAINQMIAEKIGQQKHRVWFQKSTRFTLADDYLKIGVPNPFIGNWIENHFLSVISQAALDVTGESKKVTFNIEPELSGNQRKVQLDSQARFVARAKNTTTRNRIKPATNERLLKLTMDNYVVGPSNQLAYNAATSMINEPVSPFNPLFIHGGYGLGKTHLMQGICNKTFRLNPTAKWIYVSAEEFTNQFILALKTKKLEAFRRRFRKADLLAIDDIHFLANKPSTQEEFLHTFNTIDMAGKKIVLASDAHPKMIGQLCERLVSRFVSGMVVKINSPDFKMRCRICSQRAEAMNRHLPEKVIAYIAENVRNSIREIEGALLKLTAYSSLCGQDITIAMAKEVLAEHLSRTDPIVHISDIESAATTFFGITPADIHSSKKDRTVSTARSFSMYLARKCTKMSFPEIGRLMGNKNHATVILACRKIEGLLERNADVNWQSPNGNKIVPARDILAQLHDAIA
ncbi:MAG: chromosomal replication initiator protein DnaA [Anaerohalosphaeraceae bacterium]|nr:chromosomal replication initiator protein DnaA [Anaerohalosphaeraceae bacterium]